MQLQAQPHVQLQSIQAKAKCVENIASAMPMLPFDIVDFICDCVQASQAIDAALSIQRMYKLSRSAKQVQVQQYISKYVSKGKAASAIFTFNQLPGGSGKSFLLHKGAVHTCQ